MKICRYCGRTNNDNAKNCGECGTAFEAANKAIAEPVPEKNLSGARLEKLRSGSCYSSSRDWISILSKLSIAAVAVIAGCYLLVGFRNNEILPVIYGGIIGMLGCFIIFILTHVSQVLTDIADTLIKQNEKYRDHVNSA